MNRKKAGTGCLCWNLLFESLSWGSWNRLEHISRLVLVDYVGTFSYTAPVIIVYNFNMAIDWTQIFKKYRGKWIALKDDEVTVITSGKTVKTVMNKSQKKGYSKPILFRVPIRNIPYIGYF